MHKIAAALVISLLTAGAAFAGGGTHSVTDTPIVALPAADMQGAPAWVASTAYTAGETAKHNGFYYLVIVAGTSGTAGPTGIGDSTDNTVTWRSGLRRPRAGLFIRNDGTADVTIPLDGGVGPVLGAGATLTWGGSGGVPQGTIALFSGASLTNSVIIAEW